MRVAYVFKIRLDSDKSFQNRWIHQNMGDHGKQSLHLMTSVGGLPFGFNGCRHPDFSDVVP